MDYGKTIATVAAFTGAGIYPPSSHVPEYLSDNWDYRVEVPAELIAVRDYSPSRRNAQSSPHKTGDTQADDENTFNTLAEQWKRETGMFSISQQKMSHIAYLDIIGMSWRAMPFLIKEIQKGQAHWFPAMRAIAGVDRPAENEVKSFQDAVNVWTKWWAERSIECRSGYLFSEN